MSATQDTSPGLRSRPTRLMVCTRRLLRSAGLSIGTNYGLRNLIAYSCNLHLLAMCGVPGPNVTDDTRVDHDTDGSQAHLSHQARNCLSKNGSQGPPRGRVTPGREGA